MTRTGVRRQSVERGPLPRLRREEVAPFLAGQPGHHDAADAHRPGTGQRLGVDPRADDEDRRRPGRRRGRPARQPAVWPGRELEPPARRPAEATMPARCRGRRRRIVIDEPGRTSRTMPATGVSSGSTMSPVAMRQRPLPLEQRTRRRPGRAGRGRRRRPRPASRRASGSPAIGASHADTRPEPRRRGAARRSARRTTDDRRPPRAAGRPGRRREARRRPGPRSGRRAGTRRERSVAVIGAVTSVAQSASLPRRRAARAGGRPRSGSRSGTSRRSTQQPAEAARHLDREAAGRARRAGRRRGTGTRPTAGSPGGRSTSRGPPGAGRARVVPGRAAWTDEARRAPARRAARPA